MLFSNLLFSLVVRDLFPSIEIDVPRKNDVTAMLLSRKSRKTLNYHAVRIPILRGNVLWTSNQSTKEAKRK